MKKRILSLLLAAVMCVSLMPATAMATAGLTRADLAVLFYEQFQPEAMGEVPEFADIDTCTEQQKTAIKALAAAGLLNGTTETEFAPNSPVTRGQVAVLLQRIIGGTSGEEQTIFSDLEEFPYMSPAISALVAQGILLPSDAVDGAFDPNGAATETMVKTWLSRLDTEGSADEEGLPQNPDVPQEPAEDNSPAEKPEEENKPVDTGNSNSGTGAGSTPGYHTSAWAKEEVARADAMGLLPEVLRNADLTKPITRAEFAAVVVKTYEALANGEALPAVINPFTDTEDLDVLKAYNIGAVNGVGDGTVYAPNDLLNREQAATMLTRVFKRVTIPGWTLETDSHFTLEYTMPAVFEDDAKISSWARESVYFMAANAIIEGNNNLFMPRATTTAEQANGYARTTREQAMAIAVRMVENLGK